MEQDDFYLTIAQLELRGWTRSMIKQFLGAPDTTLPVKHWRNFRGSNAYFLGRVREVESDPEFAAMYKDYSRRRHTDKMRAAFRAERTRMDRAFKRWLAALTDDDIEIMKAAKILEDFLRGARAAGYRTPHKT